MEIDKKKIKEAYLNEYNHQKKLTTILSKKYQKFRRYIKSRGGYPILHIALFLVYPITNNVTTLMIVYLIVVIAYEGYIFKLKEDAGHHKHFDD